MKNSLAIITGLIIILILTIGSTMVLAPYATARPHCSSDQKVINGRCRPKNCPHGRKANGACKPAPSSGDRDGDSAHGGSPEREPNPSHTCGAAATYFNFGCGNDDSASDKGGKNNPIVKILATVIKIFTGGVGIVAIGGVVTGGIIYSTAAGNAETAKRGLSFIFNSVIGLALYAFFVAILNFAIPGGLFG